MHLSRLIGFCVARQRKAAKTAEKCRNILQFARGISKHWLWNVTNSLNKNSCYISGLNLAFLFQAALRGTGYGRGELLIVSFIKKNTNQAISMSNFFQRTTTGVSFISAMPLRIRAFSSATDFTRMWRRKVRAILEKTHSMRLSQEPCLGV